MYKGMATGYLIFLPIKLNTEKSEPFIRLGKRDHIFKAKKVDLEILQLTVREKGVGKIFLHNVLYKVDFMKLLLNLKSDSF